MKVEKLLYKKQITFTKGKSCDICKSTTNKWLETADGNIFCSNDCYEVTWPTCVKCNIKMHGWIAHDAAYYCSNQCLRSVKEEIGTTPVHYVPFVLRKSL